MPHNREVSFTIYLKSTVDCSIVVRVFVPLPARLLPRYCGASFFIREKIFFPTASFVHVLFLESRKMRHFYRLFFYIVLYMSIFALEIWCKNTSTQQPKCVALPITSMPMYLAVYHSRVFWRALLALDTRDVSPYQNRQTLWHSVLYLRVPMYPRHVYLRWNYSMQVSTYRTSRITSQKKNVRRNFGIGDIFLNYRAF